MSGPPSSKHAPAPAMWSVSVCEVFDMDGFFSWFIPMPCPKTQSTSYVISLKRWVVLMGDWSVFFEAARPGKVSFK